MSQAIYERDSGILLHCSVAVIMLFPKRMPFKQLVFVMANKILDIIFPGQLADEPGIGLQLCLGERMVGPADIFNANSRVIKANHVSRHQRIGSSCATRPSRPTR